MDILYLVEYILHMLFICLVKHIFADAKWILANSCWNICSALTFKGNKYLSFCWCFASFLQVETTNYSCQSGDEKDCD